MDFFRPKTESVRFVEVKIPASGGGRSTTAMRLVEFAVSSVFIATWLWAI